MNTLTGSILHSQAKPMSMPIGRQQAANQFDLSNGPRLSWRGFSFGGYWFSYYYFSTASPSGTARQMMPG